MRLFSKAILADKHPAVVFDEAIDKAVATALRGHVRPDLMAVALERRADGLKMRSALSYSHAVPNAQNADWAEKEKARLIAAGEWRA